MDRIGLKANDTNDTNDGGPVSAARTMLDEFAIHALPAAVAIFIAEDKSLQPQPLAVLAYKLARAMLQEKEK